MRWCLFALFVCNLMNILRVRISILETVVWRCQTLPIVHLKAYIHPQQQQHLHNTSRREATDSFLKSSKEDVSSYCQADFCRRLNTTGGFTFRNIFSHGFRISSRAKFFFGASLLWLILSRGRLDTFALSPSLLHVTSFCQSWKDFDTQIFTPWEASPDMATVIFFLCAFSHKKILCCWSK